MNRCFSKNYIEAASKCMKRCLTLLIIRKIQIEIKWCLHHAKMAIIKKDSQWHLLVRLGMSETLIHCWLGCRMVWQFGKLFGNFQNAKPRTTKWSRNSTASMKEDSHKRSHIVWFCQYKTSMDVKNTESWFQVDRILGDRNWGVGTESSFMCDKDSDDNVLIWDSGDVCAALWVYWKTSNLSSVIGWVLWYMNCISIKLLKRKKIEPLGYFFLCHF